MAETEGLSQALRQPPLPEVQTSQAQPSVSSDMQTEMQRLRQTLAADLQGIREYLSQQNIMLSDMYHTLSQQVNELLVLTRITFSELGGNVLINSTSPVTIATVTAYPTADSRIVALGFCDCVLTSSASQHDLIFEIHKGSVGGGTIAANRLIYDASISHQWGITTRGIDESPELEQTYVFTARKDAAGAFNTNVIFNLLVAFNTQKVGA